MELEQHKNKQPHKKHSAHSKEEETQSQLHIQEDMRKHI
jgi:hypothetical protein